MQADAAALMAVHEAEVSHAWVEEDGTGAGPGSDADGRRQQRTAGQVFGHREEREERAHAHCMDLLFKLKEEAREAGGHVHVLLGNHEVRNLDLDFEYT
jgi:hypothetical protein